MKTATIRARIEPELKNRVNEILEQLGMNTTEAITLFYKQIELNQGLPFDLKIPNNETMQAMNDARANRDMEEATIEELKSDLSK